MFECIAVDCPPNVMPGRLATSPPGTPAFSQHPHTTTWTWVFLSSLKTTSTYIGAVSLVTLPLSTQTPIAVLAYPWEQGSIPCPWEGTGSIGRCLVMGPGKPFRLSLGLRAMQTRLHFAWLAPDLHWSTRPSPCCYGHSRMCSPWSDEVVRGPPLWSPSRGASGKPWRPQTGPRMAW